MWTIAKLASSPAPQKPTFPRLGGFLRLVGFPKNLSRSWEEPYNFSSSWVVRREDNLLTCINRGVSPLVILASYSWEIYTLGLTQGSLLKPCGIRSCAQHHRHWCFHICGTMVLRGTYILPSTQCMYCLYSLYSTHFGYNTLPDTICPGVQHPGQCYRVQLHIAAPLKCTTMLLWTKKTIT